MRNETRAWWCACMAVVVAGCGGSETPRRDAGSPADAGGMTDGGATDGGTSSMLDTGPDAPIATDARTCPDAGSAGGDCILYVPVGSFGPLTAACLPRCSAATATAYRACTTQSCRNAAVAGDSTSGVDYYVGTVHVTSPLDCGGCVAYQEMHCFSEVCPSEVDNYVDQCIAGGTASSCDAAIGAIDACLASLTTAEEAVVDACYASQAGPEGCFPCGG